MIFGLNFTFLSKYWFYYMDGLKVTLQLAFWTLILSSIVGVIMGMIRVQNYKIISTIIDWWINFIREFDTSKLKRILQSLETGLFFCQIFVFII